MSNIPAPNLGSVITNSNARKVIYGAYVIALTGVGAVQVGFAATTAGQPTWLTVAVAVIGYLGIPIGALALVNTPEKKAPYTDEDVAKHLA